MASILNVRGIEHLSGSQKTALYDTAVKLGMHPDWLATVISFETAGTFSPSIENAAGSGAFGLIQFMPNTARNILKTQTNHEAVTIGKLMGFKEQLQKMVVPYFKGRTFKSLSDVYLAVFYPAAMNKSDDYVIGSSPDPVYVQNAGFDRDGKGFVTRRDVIRTIHRTYDAANGERVNVPSTFGQVALGGVVAVSALYVANRWLPKQYLPEAFSFPNLNIKGIKKGFT